MSFNSNKFLSSFDKFYGKRVHIIFIVFEMYLLCYSSLLLETNKKKKSRKKYAENIVFLKEVQRRNASVIVQVPYNVVHASTRFVCFR